MITLTGLVILLESKIKVKNLKNKEFLINGKVNKFDIVVSTISPDFYFNYKFGELPFIGRDFHKIVFPSKNVFPKNLNSSFVPSPTKLAASAVL